MVVLGALTACTVQNRGLSYDDVYYNPKDKPVVAEQMNRADLEKAPSKVEIIADSAALARNQDPLLQSESRDYTKAQQTYSQDKNGVKSTNNDNYDQYTSSSFNYDDYYDYGYSARIRRFQNGYFGDYYNDYYTNRYWYDMNPGYWGSSIYSNYGFSPFYYGGSMFNFGFGYSPYNTFYNSYYGMFDPFFSPYPYYGLGYGYAGYWGGLYGGYGGYYGGGYAYGGGGYYNDFNNNSRYYGPRRGGSSNGPTSGEKAANSSYYGVAAGGNGGGGSIPTSVTAPRNGRETSAVNSGVPIGGQKAAFDAATMPAGQNGRERGGSSNLFSPSGVNNTNARTAVQSVNAPRNANGRDYNNSNQTPNGYSRPVNAPQQGPANPRTYVQQQERYSRSTAYPGSTVNGPSRYYKPTETSRTQTYNSPAYSRPRSGNEYTSPGYRSPYEYNNSRAAQPRSVSDPQRYAPPRPQSVAPASSGNRREVSGYSTPSQNYSSPEVRSYSAPSQQSYSAPSQSYSAPSQSYSAPASSSRESNSGSGSGGSYNGPRR